MESKTTNQEIILRNPFDAHMHWRNLKTLMSAVAKYSINQFSGGLLMPNTDPKIITVPDLRNYITQVYMTIKDSKKKFLPIFTFYLSPEVIVDDLVRAWDEDLFHAVKYYPKGGTTASDKGLIGFNEVEHVLETMQKYDIPLLIHGETPELDGVVVDDFEREQVFMENELTNLVKEFPALRINLEHITTKSAADFVLAHKNVTATITPQHCLLDRRALYNGVLISENGYQYDLNKNGSNPSLVCRPILKHYRELRGIQHALKLQAAEGLRKFGLGTDTAPHLPGKKYCECGACGVFSAPIALELYAMAFEQMGILDHLETFACDIMPEFYGIKNNLPKKTMRISQVGQLVQPEYDGIVTPFAGLMLPWKAEQI